MKIVVAGGTGFLGAPLVTALAGDGYEVVVLTRGGGPANPPARPVAWLPDGGAGAWAAEIDGADAVVNLAGESIAAKRWTTEQKQRILDSRMRSTRSLVAAVTQSKRRPRSFVSASAVGYYGPRGDEVVTEETAAGADFLANVCAKWEAEADRAAGSGTRVVCIRTGLVLERDGGALPQMLLPFRMGVGGPLGSGRQYWPWVHRDDWLALARWALRNDQVAGAVNVTAPEPVTNAVFARALGRAVRRPSFVPAPAFALRLILGEMADALLLTGQRAVPAKALALGFPFKYTGLDDALASIFARG